MGVRLAFATFFFYLAVFLSSWLGDDRRGGLLVTLISLGLIAYSFVEPIHSFNELDITVTR